jgi:hypothetical protein
MIYPESQKMGIPQINPVIPNAGPLCFSPVRERIKPAMLAIPPVLSSVIPIMAPRIIRNPIDAIVLPKPPFNVLTMVSGGRVAKARKTETRNKATKALIFKTEVNQITANMLTITNIEIREMLMLSLQIATTTPQTTDRPRSA